MKEKITIRKALALGAASKSRPRCRRVIERDGLRPVVNEDGTLDAHGARDRCGRYHRLSDGLCRELRHMLVEGRWPGLLPKGC